MELKTNLVFDEFYKLKEAYETAVKNQRLEILKQTRKKGVTDNDIRKKLINLKTKCINCQRIGGSIFSSVFDEKELTRVLTAKCGVPTNPCSLNIQIHAGSHELLQDILKHDENELEKIKQVIIDEKNKLLFGYMKSEEVVEHFDELKKQINEYSGSIEYYTKLYYDKIDNKEENKELSKLTKDSFILIQQIKDFIQKFNEEDNDNQNQNVISAVKAYTEQLKPHLNKIRNLKYKQSMVWYDEDNETYHLIQQPQTINSLEVALVDTKVVS